MIDGILSGLVVSQVESTGISLLVSIFVLFFSRGDLVNPGSHTTCGLAGHGWLVRWRPGG